MLKATNPGHIIGILSSPEALAQETQPPLLTVVAPEVVGTGNTVKRKAKNHEWLLNHLLKIPPYDLTSLI